MRRLRLLLGAAIVTLWVVSAAAVTQPRSRVCLITNTGDVLYTQALAAKKLRPDFELHEFDWPGVHAIYDDPVRWTDAAVACLN